jgi:hypothetical protein
MKTVLCGTAKISMVLSWVRVASVLAMFMVTGNGCSVYMASTQPTQKNLQFLSVGTPRSLVLAELGQPQASEVKDGKRVDVFSFVQGYSKGTKATRAVFHGVADVFTLGLWEVVGTPTESIFNGEQMACEVTYDTSDRVEKVVTLIGEKAETMVRPTQAIKEEPLKEMKVEPKAEPSTEEIPNSTENDK